MISVCDIAKVELTQKPNAFKLFELSRCKLVFSVRTQWAHENGLSKKSNLLKGGGGGGGG